jgi:predicted acetylornithine/succinylornithine family transaminase
MKRIFDNYLLSTYRREGPVFVRGKGSWLWDERGRRYLDLFPGWGVSILGHCHRRLVKVIKKQAAKLIHIPNNLYQQEQALLAKDIVKNSYPAKVFFANSGAEAVEGAIKFSRLYGKGEKYEIITMENSFHGRTFGALSATGQSKYKSAFKPLLPKFVEAKFNDFGDFKKRVTRKTAGVLIELIQGEGGVNVAEKGYVKELKEYCRRNNLLFIVDEVQTGMGRTGEWFCCQNYGIIPDIMILSKGLGGGVPISAIVVKRELAGLIKPGMHASTFGGSPFVSAVSREVFRVIKEEKILYNARRMGRYLIEKLRELKGRFTFIKNVRGVGLMVGIELGFDSYPVFLKCLEKRLIVNSTHKNVLRIMPALNVTKQELNIGLSILEDVFVSLKE